MQAQATSRNRCHSAPTTLQETSTTKGLCKGTMQGLWKLHKCRGKSRQLQLHTRGSPTRPYRARPVPFKPREGGWETKFLALPHLDPQVSNKPSFNLHNSIMKLRHGVKLLKTLPFQKNATCENVSLSENATCENCTG